MTGRHDRYGEPHDVETKDTPTHECTNGWLDVDAAVPCLICRPHLDQPRGHTPRPAPEVAREGSAAVRRILDGRTGRRRQAAAARSAMQEARDAGLAQRHAAKLEHLKARTLTVPAEALTDALSAARCQTCQHPAAIEIGLDVAARLEWRAIPGHTTDCTGGEVS